MILSGQLVLAVLTAVLLGMASSAQVQRVRYRAEGQGHFLPKLVAVIVLLNALLFAWRVQHGGIHTAVRSSFDLTVLLVTMLTAVAWFSERNRAVVGVDVR